MSTTVAGKPGKKFPPLCWTRDEALVLIEAYRERWYALHRAFLKNPDWDAVAEKVAASCPDVTPAKTSAQCRHKMEKLRQRHRAEKQRAASFPAGRFQSSWFYFEAMEAMERGPDAELGNNCANSSEIGNGIGGLESLDHRSLNPGRGILFKPSNVQNLVTLAGGSVNQSPNFESRVSRVSNHNSSHTNNWANQEEGIEEGYRIDSSGYRNQKHSVYTGGNGVKFGKMVHDQEMDEKGEMWVKVSRRTNVTNRFEGNHQKGKKRGNGGIHEVVSSIKVLGDGFMKMEKMKMDMVREIERMRMETEMKRNELILESQKQIVDVFLKGLVESRKQARTETMGDS